MAKKTKVTTLEALREAVSSIRNNPNEKLFLLALLDELEEEKEVSVEHGDLKGGVFYLDTNEEDEEEYEDEEADEDEESEEVQRLNN